MASGGIKRYSLAQLERMRARRSSRTRPDAAVHEPDAAFWRHAKVVLPPPGKTSIHLRLDRDVLALVQATGPRAPEPDECRLALLHGGPEEPDGLRDRGAPRGAPNVGVEGAK